MGQEITLVDLFAPVILTLITGSLTIYLIYKRKSSKLYALDWFIAIFGGVSLLGIVELLKLYFRDSWVIFKYVSEENSTLTDPVRIIHLSILIILFLISENFLSDSFNSLRLVIMTSITSIYIGLSIYYLSTGNFIYSDDIFPFTQHTTLDSFFFDFIQLFILSTLLYVYITQYKVSISKQIKNRIIIIITALILFVLIVFIELLNNFLPMPDVNTFMLSLPSFLLLAYFYIKYPNLAYLAPARIKFLQIVTTSGELLYAVEFNKDLESSDLLLAPSLTAINSILGDLLHTDDVNVKEYKYDNGYILFEKLGKIIVVLESSRPSQILRRAMRYLIRSFVYEFGDQFKDYYKEYIARNDHDIDLNDILIESIPVVQTRGNALINSKLTSKSVNIINEETADKLITLIFFGIGIFMLFVEVVSNI